MINLCLRYTKSEDDAVEILNNGFLKIFLNIQRYDPALATPYTWIRTVVINCCLDFIKQKEKIPTHHLLDNSVDVHIDAEAINRMDVSQLLSLVRELPPATQAVFNLYVIDGYNHKEIGQLLKIKEGTSKWHLSEARKSLQRMIRLEEVKL